MASSLFRETFVRRFPSAFAVVALLLVATSTCGSAGAEEVTARVMVVGTEPDHPWGAHMYQFDGDVLAKCLRQTAGVRAESALGWPVDSSRLSDVDALVFYSRPMGEMVLHPDHRQRFLTLMDRGVGLVAIHWGTGIGYSPVAEDPEVRETFKNLLGGWFRRPPCGVQIGRSWLTQKDAGHPACRGWSEFEIHDEFYLDPVLHANAQPLLQVDVDGRSQTVAWSLERTAGAGGRSVGITLGHFHHNFQNEAFRRILVNAILWSARLEVPPTGAPVKLDARDLELPAQP